MYALLASRHENMDAIDTAINAAFGDRLLSRAASLYDTERFEPFSPALKRASALVRRKDTGELFEVSKGAPEVMCSLTGINRDTADSAHSTIEERSKRGFKTLCVCVALEETNQEKCWRMVGILSIMDPPRHDTKATIDKALELGVAVKMITGDHLLIAQEVARKLGLGHNIFGSSVWLSDAATADSVDGLGELAELADGFSSVKPKHK